MDLKTPQHKHRHSFQLVKPTLTVIGGNDMRRNHYYLGLDQGTTGTTALLLNESWDQIARGHAEIHQSYPKAGWVEHDPVELYDSLIEAAAQALRSVGANAQEIRCIGLDNQGGDHCSLG